MDYDVIVIGSGFGGAITGCRLAESGLKVLILERGRRWDATNYPRKPADAWTWNRERPERENGWVDMHVFPHMAVAAGAAVGGGSLIYANISCEAPRSAFETGWPIELTYDELKPHYDTVATFMNVQPVPDNQWTERMKLMKEAADKIGAGNRFRKLELAVSFDPAWTYDQPDAHAPSKSKRFVNAQGVEQGTCTHIGNCDIGCEVDAKNTLDRNYIPWAEKHGAEVRELHLVTDIAVVDGGYRVSFDGLRTGVRVPGSQTARIVIVAAGSMGSTELLLRCRDVNKTLPNISQFLGRNWSSNGDFLTPALYADRSVNPTKGPTIACAIDFLDRSVDGQSFWVQDGGFPDLLGDALQGVGGASLPGGPEIQLVVQSIRHMLRADNPLQNVMPWFGQGVDAGNGVLSLTRSPLSSAPCLTLEWDVAKSRAAVDALVNMHLKLSAATGGQPVVPPTWSLSHYLVTPHPLGGCNMGSTAADGVVDHTGEVFGYPNLSVCDGAIVPRAVGVNPSRTIGALAERTAKMIVGRAAAV